MSRIPAGDDVLGPDEPTYDLSGVADLLGVTVTKVQQHLKERYPAITSVRSAVLWYKGCSKVKPDYHVQYLPTNPWIHQPFEEWDTVRPHNLGAWIKHSGWYPNLQRRLYRKSAGRYDGIVHETLVFAGEAGYLKGDLLHYTVDNFAEHEENVERYSTLAAQKMFDEGKRKWRGAMWLATPWNFLQSFAFRLGFLDGYRGALIARMNARTTRLKFAKGRKIQRSRRSRRPNGCTGTCTSMVLSERTT